MSKNILLKIIFASFALALSACNPVKQRQNSGTWVFSQENVKTPFEEAAELLKTGDLALFKTFCETNLTVCKLSTDPNGNNLLMKAIELGKTDIARYLTDTFSASLLEHVNNNRENALFLALTKPDPAKEEKELALYLLTFASKDHLTTKNRNGLSVLMALDKETFTKLCEVSPDICKDDIMFYQTITSAKSSDEKKFLVAWYLNKALALPKFGYDDDQNQLLTYAIKNDDDFAKYLVDALDEPNLKITNSLGQNALSMAIDLSKKDLVAQILTKYPHFANDKTIMSPKTIVDAQIKSIIDEVKIGSIEPIEADNISINKDRLYTIKQSSFQPILYSANGQEQKITDVSSISFDEFDQAKHILAPLRDPFVQIFNNNPFSDLTSINLVRPSLWGIELVEKTKNNDDILYTKSQALPPEAGKAITQNDFTLFADLEREENNLGKGGFGAVYALKKDGNEYAVKITNQANLEEFQTLEKLLFTGAVAKTYGYFTKGEKNYLLMEKGTKSLDKVISEQETLDPKILLDSADNMLILNTALKKLKIVHRDIKPANFILTDEGIKAIDISKEETYGYTGVPSSELFTRLILSAFLKQSIKADSSFIKNYMFYDYTYSLKGVTDYYLIMWFRSYCSEQKWENCSSIETFDDLYKKLGTKQRIQLVKNKFVEFEGVKLPIIQLMDTAASDENWQVYFDNRSKLSKDFCEHQKIRSNLLLDVRSQLYVCDEFGNPTFSFESNDEPFKNFVDFYFEERTKEKVWKNLYKMHKQRNVIKYILETQVLPVLPELNNKLIELYDS